MALELRPHRLHRVEFRSLGRQTLGDGFALGGGEVVSYQRAAMDGYPIPNDEDAPLDVASEVLDELDDLRALDAAWVDLEVEPSPCESADD